MVSLDVITCSGINYPLLLFFKLGLAVNESIVRSKEGRESSSSRLPIWLFRLFLLFLDFGALGLILAYAQDGTRFQVQVIVLQVEEQFLDEPPSGETEEILRQEDANF